MRGFTTTCAKIQNVLQNKVLISQAQILNNEKQINEKNKKIEFLATWDTGATNTMISQKVVDECKLISTGVTLIGTAGGVIQANTYVIDLVLPDNVVINNLNVACGKLNNTDVLVGMDIMNNGDFAVSNYEGQTRFTFRVPSLQPIDFVKDRTIKVPDKIERNTQCPCGSRQEIQELLWKTVIPTVCRN